MTLPSRKEHADQGVFTGSEYPQDAMQAWEGLMAHCVGVAKAAASLSDLHEHATEWKGSVEAIITLHSVTMALDQLVRLGAEERAVGMDRAEILIQQGARALSSVWGGQAMPDGLLELMGDAREALERAKTLGIHWVVKAHGFEMGPTEAFVKAIREKTRDSVEIYAAKEGDRLAIGHPAAVVVGDDERRLSGLGLAGCEMEACVRPMMQVYRVPDEADKLMEVAAGLPQGRPVLQPVL